MLFSILTPSYGYGRFMEACVRSVLDQEGVEVEHIVMDGASRDETVDVLQRLGESDERLRWASQPDKGQSDALNQALREARGDWIGWLNVDEVYLPGALSAVRKRIDEVADVGLVHGDFYEMTADGQVTRLVAEHGWSRLALRRGCYIPTCATFFRRDTLVEAEPWNSALPSMMDWDLFLRLTGRGVKVAHVRQPLAGFRVHPGQVTASSGAQSAEEFATIRRSHGIPVSGATLTATLITGRLAHVARKVANGGYLRERRVAGRVAGRNLVSPDTHAVGVEWRVQHG
jgi:glycosyltransferase involved in cell wall biosynthesis